MEPLLDLLALPDKERISLESPPLILAVCQIQFTTLLSTVDPTVISSFHDRIRKTYPLVNRTARVELGVGDSNIRQTQTPQWEFTDLDAAWQVVLSATSISLETRTYKDFSEFLNRLEELLTHFIDHFQPAIGTRLGLRYINELRPKSLSWSEAISQAMLGPLADPILSENTEQLASVQQIALRYPHNRGITINHGLVPGGTTIRLRQGEQAPEGLFYLLDFDVFREFPLPAGLPMESKPICAHVAEYHQIIYRLFRWSVTDQYLTGTKGE